MNPLNIIASLLRPLLYPLSFLYGGIMWLRNRLYDGKVLASVQFDLPVISVGNLSTGGTGKTPHIEYLIRLLQYEYQVATMSRGYKRSTRGFILANHKSTAHTIGDEPMQFHIKFPDAAVSVCEDRMTGIPELLANRPDIDVILLDDAFQHRSVQPGLNILITDFSKPFYKDYILPFGSLRESRKAYKRADVIIVSKCPDKISTTEQEKIITKIQPRSHQQVFFTKIKYGAMIDFFTGNIISSKEIKNIVLSCGIAKPEPLVQYLQTIADSVHLLRYPDHHYFSLANIEEMKTTYEGWAVEGKYLVTTEKDAVRLAIHKKELQEWGMKIAVIPIEISFIANGQNFNTIVKQYIQKEKEASDEIEFEIVE